MHRREILATCTLGVSALAGCTSRGQTSPNPQKKREISTGDTKHELPAGLEADVSVKRSQITAEKTALVEVTLRNTSSTSYSLLGGSEFPFSSMGSEDGAWLLLQGENPEKSDTGCWKPKSHRHIGDSDIAYKYTVKAGDEYTGQFELWGNPEDDRCLPTGESWFVHKYRDMKRNLGYSLRFSVMVTSTGAST